MNRSIVTTMVFGASLLSSAAMHAATPAATSSQIASPVHATLAHVKIVHFNLHNDTTEPMTVIAGAQTIAVAPGKTIAVKVPSGVSLVAGESSPKHTAGSLLLEVIDSMGGATVLLH
jgi:hypothetical protein